MTDKREWVESEDGKYMELAPHQVKVYRVALARQTNLWLNGVSVHNEFSGECTPDFSCCGGTLWHLELRKQFLDADDRQQLEMLMGSLNLQIEKSGGLATVHLAGTADFVATDDTIH